MVCATGSLGWYSWTVGGKVCIQWRGWDWWWNAGTDVGEGIGFSIGGGLQARFAIGKNWAG
jgi:hypothetical protein